MPEEKVITLEEFLEMKRQEARQMALANSYNATELRLAKKWYDEEEYSKLRGHKNTSKWKALYKVNFKAIPDSTFIRENTGLGDIEYFAAEYPNGITYPNGYHREHPSPGNDVILYNPKTNDEQDIRLDALHLMSKDTVYAVLNDLYRYHAKDGDVMYNAEQRYTEDVKKYGKENVDSLEQYFNNEADGLLRNMLIEGTPEYIKSKRYYPHKQHLREWNSHLVPYIDAIQQYLETGEKPWYVLEPAVVTADKKLGGMKKIRKKKMLGAAIIGAATSLIGTGLNLAQQKQLHDEQMAQQKEQMNIANANARIANLNQLANNDMSWAYNKFNSFRCGGKKRMKANLGKFKPRFDK